MNARRLISASFAGVALVAAPLLGAGVADASESHGHQAPQAPATPDCSSNATGSASNSPGVLSGNVVQVPVAACQLTGDLGIVLGAPMVPAG